MTVTLKGLHKYENAETYDDEQTALREIADINDLSIHQTRARLVNLGIYNNKAKKSTRILKSSYVNELTEKLEDLTDTDTEYLERLTITLLKKLIQAIK